MSLPFDDFGGSGRVLHFAHANGYPPRAYQALLGSWVRRFHVIAMLLRPLWPDPQPLSQSSWRPLVNDLLQFFTERRLIRLVGVGHSLGATLTLRAAIQKPGLFSALVLIDPVLFPRWMNLIVDLSARLKLPQTLHPLARSALRRRTTFPSREAMFDHYRSKPVFSRLSDEALGAYVQAATRAVPGGGFALIYPPEWEAQIYATSGTAEADIWSNLQRIKAKVLVIRGERSPTFPEATARRLQKALPNMSIRTIPGTGHLVPLERPEAVATATLQFLGADP